ncbi:MAG: carboxylate--amine ligase, partial [Ktedonobacteraceae bacterium]
MPQQRRLPGAVVVGSDFRSLGVVRSLGRKGIPSVVIDNQIRSAWFSRYVVKRYTWHGSLDDADFLNFLLTLGKERHLEGWILFPSSDEVVELIARNIQQISTIYQPITQSWEIVQWANDKRLTYQMAQKLGVPFPKTWYPSTEDDLSTMGITLPAIIKPAISVRMHHAIGLKALPVYKNEELLTQYQLASKIIAPDEIMVQELIPGNGSTQYSVAAFCKDGDALSSMTARRTRQYPIDYGLNSCFVEAIQVPALFEPAEALLRFMKISGIVEVEFKYDQSDKQYKLLDINARPWGWHSLCGACGLDFPYIQYSDILGQTPSTLTPHYGSHWVRFLTDIPAGLRAIQAGMITPVDYVRSFQGKTVFSVFDWRDPFPVLA